MKRLFFLAFFLQAFFAQSQDTILVLGRDSIFPNLVEYPAIFKSTFSEKILKTTRIIVVISSVQSNLSEEDVELLYNFVFQGGSMYIAAENEPFTSEANQLTQRFFFKQFQGEITDTIAKVAIPYSSNGLFRDAKDVDAGKTVTSFPLDYRLKVELWVADNPLIMSAQFGEGRVILDGGYSRFNSLQFNSRENLLPLLDWLSRK
jgi:hypothetical protein